MPSNKNITPLEAYVSAYFKNAGRAQVHKNFVRKALALVNEKLGIPCCTTPNATINLYTRFDNDLTNRVSSTLAGMSKLGNVQSLIRVKRILTNVLTPPCCV